MTKDCQEIIASFDTNDYQCIVKLKWLRDLEESLVDRMEWAIFSGLKWVLIVAIFALGPMGLAWMAGFGLSMTLDGFLTGMKVVGILKPH